MSFEAQVQPQTAPGAAWTPAPPSPGMVWVPVAPETRKRRGTIGWDILLGIDVSLIMLGGVLNVLAYLAFLGGGPAPSGETSPDLMWLNNAVNFVMMAVIPLVWALGTRVVPVDGMLQYMRLWRPWPAIGHGLGYAALLLGLVIFLLLFVEVFDVPMEDTGGEQRFTGLTFPLVIATSVVAGFAEEVFFRGLLQKWIGVWGQALVFGLFHIAGGWLPFLITGSIGLLFGLLVKNGRSLWLVVTAHFAYDFFLLSLSYLSQETDRGTALSALLG